MKDVLLDFLITKRGIVSFPKSDGRIEIPQTIVKMMGWDKCNEIYIKKSPSGLLLTSTTSVRGLVGKVVVSCGRVRIPAKILRSSNLENKKIVLAIKQDYVIARSDNRKDKEEITELLNGFCSHCKQRLEQIVEFVLGNVTQEPEEEPIKEVKEPEVVEQVNNDTPFKIEPEKEFFNGLPLIVKDAEDGVEPFLFLLERDCQMVFRPIDMPYRFPGYWLNHKNELVLFKNYSSSFQKPGMFYLIPGIKRMPCLNHFGDSDLHPSTKKLRAGFLLVNEQTYGGIAYTQDSSALDAKYIRDLIFMYRPFSPAMYKVYKNPPCYDVNYDEIEHARHICDNPINFLDKTFRSFEQNDDGLIAMNPPPLSIHILEKFKCKPKIG